MAVCGSCNILKHVSHKDLSYYLFVTNK